jgi:hypothetical protein
MNQCNCGLIKQGKAGTSFADGIEVCNACRLPVSLEALKEYLAAIPAPPDMGTTEWLWRRNGIAVDALRATGGKYERALNGEGFASFSVIGADSWAEFAALSMEAMQLETLTVMAKTLEQLVDRVNALESALQSRAENR